MADIGHAETDALLEKLERELAQTYSRAAKEIEKKFKQYTKRFKANDKKYSAMVKAGTMKESEYLKWRKTQMLQGKYWREMLNTMTEDCVSTDMKAMSILNGYIPDAYSINRNFAAFEVEKGSLIDTSFTLYDRATVERLMREKPDLLPKPAVDIPKDKRWSKMNIRRAITQSILQGESIDNAAKRLMDVIGMSKSAAVRNARTAITGAENAGRVDSYVRAQDFGIDLKQKWMATLDSRTRHSHAVLDGEEVAVGTEFSNGCRYPGDPNGPPEEVYNCRCTLVAELTGFNFSDAPRNNKLAGMSYEDWKEMHRQALESPKKAGYSETDFIKQVTQNAREFTPEEHEALNFDWDYWNSLSYEERDAIEKYTGSWYEDINSVLRGQQSGFSGNSSIHQLIDSCEKVLGGSSLAEDTLLYRGMGSTRTLARALGISPDDVDGIFGDGSIIGQMFVEKGFCSTGINADAGWDKEVLLDIIAPKGTLGMYVDPVSSVQGEEEFLLQRGAMFKIVGAETAMDRWGRMKYTLKVVVVGFQK